MSSESSPSSPRSSQRAGESRRRCRLILVDANIRKGFGKTFQLAQILARGSLQLGWRPVLISHCDFNDDKAFEFKVPTASVFQVDNLIQWSLGVDGQSTTRRDVFGKPFGGTGFQNAWMRMSEKLVSSERNAETMLRKWANGFTKMLKVVRPRSTDTIVINHCNDFTLLALAAAIRQSPGQPPLRIEAIFHSPIYLPNQANAETAKQYAAQVNDSLSLLRSHKVRLHATNIKLAKQIQKAGVRQSVGVIDLPTQARPAPVQPVPVQPPQTQPVIPSNNASNTKPIKVVLAGNPNKNQRHRQLLELLDEIYHTHLKSGKFRVATRPLTDDAKGETDTSTWRQVLPSSLHSHYERGLKSDAGGPIEIVSHQLSGEAYHQWLDTADVGLFLYAPAIYHARASSVLHDLLIRGTPVIVPDSCTLADEIRKAGGHRSIGLIYQTTNEIPGLLLQFAKWREEMLQRAKAYASKFADRHDARRTLAKLGVDGQSPTRRVA